MRLRYFATALTPFVLFLGVLAPSGFNAQRPAHATGLMPVCLFESRSDALTPHCEQGLRSLIQLWLQHPAQVRRVDIEGYIDFSEVESECDLPAWECRLVVTRSEERAQAVAEWLVAAGIPREAITVSGRGAQHYLMPGGPMGLGDPFNRRVEVRPHP